MIDIQNMRAYGFEGAIRGMRNPYNSWAKSDSVIEGNDILKLGEEDLKLCKKLVKAGSDHRKFMRMIHVQMDITAPLFMLKELDTYKVGTTSNSCSTMHTVHKKPFENSDFSWEHMRKIESTDELFAYGEVTKGVLENLNRLRDLYIETKNMDYWYSLIEMLPSSYNQLRTYDFDYETLIRIYFARKAHKLAEWHTFCDTIKGMPYMSDFIKALEEPQAPRMPGLSMDQVVRLLDRIKEEAGDENPQDYIDRVKERFLELNEGLLSV